MHNTNTLTGAGRRWPEPGLGRFDLNLLKSFLALCEHRSVTRAAAAMHVSQSAMSHALKRLRQEVGDELFLQTGGAMVPTPRALALEAPVREALAQIRRALAPIPDFDPASTCHRFSLGLTDYAEYVLLPPLIGHLNDTAPGIDLAITAFVSPRDDHALETGEVDLAVQISRPPTAAKIGFKHLYDEPLAVLLRVGHPALARRLTLRRYARLAHAVVESVEAAGEVDRALREAGLERRIRLASPNFLSLPILLAESDMVATLPVGLASRFVRGGRLTLCPLPIEVPPVPVFALWHALYEHERPQRWLRDTLVSVATECAPTVGLVARV